MKRVNIIGAGISGLSAAICLAKNGTACCLISSMPSERAQSVLAEGGINAALDTMGENDTIKEHFDDTMKGGCFLESASAVKNLTDNAPEVVRELFRLGAPFMSEKGRLILRNFGGQKKKRTAFAKSSTGKMIMTALIDEARKYEASGLIKRYPHHEFAGINITDGSLDSIVVRDSRSNEFLSLAGNTIICTGGMNGFFEGMTTGTTQNTGNAAAILFDAGVEFADLEFIQYHPTTVGITGKRMLISEAARGEGGRLFIMRNNEKWYFMEEKYPELKNLMPRDVVSREMFFVKEMPECPGEVYLDMTELSSDIWKNKLSDLRKEIIAYLHKDPAAEPIAVSPGIHFFMGGIRVSDRHETNIRGLFAAGECACKYHGANRLGGNSLLGAAFGGKTAAEAAMKDMPDWSEERISFEQSVSSPSVRSRLKDILLGGLGIARDSTRLEKALDESGKLYREDITAIDRMRVRLGTAALRSALERKESRGSHYRTDYPDKNDKYRKLTVVKSAGDDIILRFIPADSEEKL